MVTDIEATDTVPTPPKRKPGRPKKAVNNDSSIADLQRMVANLQDALLQNGAERTERQLASLSDLPAPSDSLVPGSYVQIGVDSSQAPILGKVRWTKAWIEKSYGPVTWTPSRSMGINPHGVQYKVEAGEEVTTPSIVKSLFDEVIRGEKGVHAATRALSAQEISDIDARANDAPGTKQYSRLYRTAGGLNVRSDTPVETTE